MMSVMKLWLCFTLFCSVVFCATLLWTYNLQIRMMKIKELYRERAVREYATHPAVHTITTDRDMDSKTTDTGFNTDLHSALRNVGGEAVLIMTYVRSGSSLVGELFNQNPDAFFIFEPTHELDRASVKRHFTYTDYTQRSIQSTGKSKLQFMADVVKNLISCDFDKVPVNVLAPESPSHWFFIALGRHIYLQKYASCILKYNTTKEDIKCLPLLKSACDKSFKAFKLVVFRMAHVEPILRDFPRVKVLYLVRDPRASILSMRKYKLIRPVTLARCNMTCEIIKRCKEHMIPDIAARDTLEQQYPGRIMTLRYEDLADEPMNYGKKIYEFIGREMPDRVQQWLFNTTSGKIEGDKMTDPYGTSRENSSQTAHLWETKIQPSLAEEVESHCTEVLRQLNYEPYASIQARHIKGRSKRKGGA